MTWGNGQVRRRFERANVLAVGRTLSEFDRAILDTLEDYPEEAPFALLYHVQHSSERVFCAC